ncbi:MAG: two-component system, LytTR family, response regulator [Thermoanaerobacterium sp.]|jgi:LytTr DNA-binding domain./Response regulator receiver domain.|nr:two-component system, LytTR family, response regulator [Thermoanaerobacterium sp.]MDK2806216.1 two-component system, LytTR family, response regulator [Thermoanaerobacterium sp.]MDN5316979.1 two-component system, LytTR family, response regulator [Thermoanaerobacterium sp.]
MKALLVDDEKPARDELKFILEEIGVDIVGEADNFKSAVKVAQLKEPDVIFLDIELGGENGFDILENLRKKRITSDVVFVTAYSNYAVKAFEVNAKDYVLKPFSPDRIKFTIEKLNSKLKEKNKKLDIYKITVTNNGRIYLIDIRDAYYFYANGRNIFVKTADNEYMVENTLKELEDRFYGLNYMRTHKSYLVNIDKVNEVIPWFNGTYMLKFKDISDEVPVSRNYAKKFKDEVLK